MESSSVEVDFFSDEKKKKKSRLERVQPELDLKFPGLGIKKEDLTINVSGRITRSSCVFFSSSFRILLILFLIGIGFLLRLVTAFDDWHWKRPVNGR
jgi:hypothetical protein